MGQQGLSPALTPTPTVALAVALSLLDHRLVCSILTRRIHVGAVMSRPAISTVAAAAGMS